MKTTLFTAIFSSLIGLSSAFTTIPGTTTSSLSLHASVSDSEPPKEMSESLPFLERPQFLDGTYAGDVGFDPLNFARGTGELFSYREAEIKHGRLAMLAAAGWPLSEVFDKPIADSLGLNPLLDSQDRVPSPLIGGLGNVSPLYWITVLALTAAVDVYGTLKAGNALKSGYTPGDLGFDPLGLLPEDEDGQRRMKLAEIKHARLAMVAIVGFAVQEYVSKLGVVDETPFFFSPFSF